MSLIDNTAASFITLSYAAVDVASALRDFAYVFSIRLEDDRGGSDE